MPTPVREPWQYTLDRTERATRWNRRLSRLHADLSAIAVVLSGGFALLMMIRVATAGAL